MPIAPFRATPAVFQSTLPAWGETADPVFNTPSVGISIHSPRMGRDRSRPPRRRTRSHFNPLSPHGERPIRRIVSVTVTHFNPLSPHGERQNPHGSHATEKTFQSTLPAWGETCGSGTARLRSLNFNPLSPHGERPHPPHGPLHALDFNPLSPHGERLALWKTQRKQRNFNPLSPHGERPG